MPVQSSTPNTVFYVEGDTGPSLRAQITDDDGVGIDLTNASVITIRIAPQRWDYYFSPVTPIIDDDTCTADPDQTTYPGWLDWYPAAGELSPPGSYQYTFRVTWNDGTIQTYPQDQTLPLIIKPRVGGNT